MTDTDKFPLQHGQHIFSVFGEKRVIEYIVHNTQNTRFTKQHPLLVVQCPGWGLASRYLQASLTSLADHFTLVFLHPRGSGASSPPDSYSEMSSWAMADDLERLRVHLGIVSFPALFGHSHSGAIVLSYAEQYPEKVERIVLVGHQLIGSNILPQIASFVHEPCYKSAFEVVMSPDILTDEEFTLSLRELLPLYLKNPKAHLPVLAEALGEDHHSAWCYHAQNKADREAVQLDMEKDEIPVMIRLLSHVKAKALIIYDKDDNICPLKNAYTTAEGIPGSKLVVYGDCGHFPWLEKLDVLQEVKTFLL